MYAEDLDPVDNPDLAEVQWEEGGRRPPANMLLWETYRFGELPAGPELRRLTQQAQEMARLEERWRASEHLPPGRGRRAEAPAPRRARTEMTRWTEVAPEGPQA